MLWWVLGSVLAYVVGWAATARIAFVEREREHDELFDLWKNGGNPFDNGPPLEPVTYGALAGLMWPVIVICTVIEVIWVYTVVRPLKKTVFRSAAQPPLPADALEEGERLLLETEDIEHKIREAIR